MEENNSIFRLKLRFVTHHQVQAPMGKSTVLRPIVTYTEVQYMQMYDNMAFVLTMLGKNLLCVIYLDNVN